MALDMFVAFCAVIVIGFGSYKIYKNYVYWNMFFKIPGIKGYPIIGNFLDIMVPPVELFLGDRRRNKENYPIYRVYGLGTYLVMLLTPEDFELVLTNSAHIKKSDHYGILENWLGTGLLTSNGEKWHSRRKILTPAFHFSILQGFVNIFNKEATNLAQHISLRTDEPYINVVEPITEFTLESIAETSMGVKLSSLDDASKAYKKSVYEITLLFIYKVTRFWCIFPLTYAFTPTKRNELKLVKDLHSFSRTVIKNRQRSQPTYSYSVKKRLAMLDLLIKAKNDGAKIDDEGIREEVDTFMFEGHDTTSMAICFALMVLANQVEAQEQIYNEITEILGDDLEKLPSYKQLQTMTFLERCIKECLRLYPSVPFIGRLCGEDLKTSTGYVIPKGCNIFMYIYDLHRNPKIYPDPEKFDPDRFLPQNVLERHYFAYLPFSAGSRNCIGQRYAILEIKAALCALLRRFKLEKFDTPETIVLRSDLVLRSTGPIRVKFIKR